MPSQSTTPRGTPVTPRRLLESMDINHLGAVDDEQHVLRRSQTLNGDTTSYAASMFQSSQVQQLLRAPESGIVLVNGHTDRSQNTKITPISHVCATLIQALRRSANNNLVLSFFCGQHTATTDSLTGPQGLMRSLVAYLVLSLVQNECIPDSAPILLEDFEGDFKHLSFQDICQLFHSLMAHVRREMTVYCIIDGISYYERQDWKDDYNLMMECFGSIISHQATIAPFKLFVTSPTTSRWLNYLEPHQHVSLRNTRARGSSNPEAYIQSALGS